MARELIYKDEARRAILQTNSMFAYCINNIKPVDAVEVVHGRWKRVFDDSAGWVDMCNICKEFGAGTKYCPNCGADMR